MDDSKTETTYLGFLCPKNCLPALQWWWRPILWDLEYQYWWIIRLLNHNTIPPQIIHNWIFLILVSLLYLLCDSACILKIFYLIPVNTRVTDQSLVLLLVELIDIKVMCILEKIQPNIFNMRIFYIVICTCTIPVLQSILVIVITSWCYVLIIIRRVCIMRDNSFQRQCMIIFCLYCGAILSIIRNCQFWRLTSYHCCVEIYCQLIPDWIKSTRAKIFSRPIQNGDTEPNSRYSLKKYFQIV